MTRLESSRLLLAPALVTVLLVGCAAPAPAQTFGLGYIANAPEALLGVGVYGLVVGEEGSRWGLYVDAKFDARPRTREPGFMEGMTAVDAEERGDAFFSEDPSWRSFNLAVLRELGRELTAYAGAGQAGRTTYAEYFDASRDIGRAGFYWVEDEARSGTGMNLMAGALLRIAAPVRVHVGLESRPAGVTVGLSYRFGS